MHLAHILTAHTAQAARQSGPVTPKEGMWIIAIAVVLIVLAALRMLISGSSGSN